jgi:hypothetical protein
MMITLEMIAQAVEKKLELKKEEAQSIAGLVMDYFGFDNRIVDNNIDKSDRKLFYMLQEAGFLNSTWETLTLHNGKNWRIYYWYFSEHKIRECLAEQQEEEDIYSSIPDEAWKMHSPVLAH